MDHGIGPQDQEHAGKELAANETPRPRRGSRWGARLAILSALLLVLGPLAPGEIGRWHKAVAHEKRLSGELTEALARLDKAIDWTPTNGSLYALRSEWRLEAKDKEGALADAAEAIRLSPDDPAGYQAHAIALQKLGRFEESIADAQTLLKLSGVEDAAELEKLVDAQTYEPPKSLPVRVQASAGSALNYLAYSRALAGIELEAGLKDVVLAIKIDGANAAYLDTRGFLRHLLGDDQQAVDDLDQAVAVAEIIVKELPRVKRTQMLDPREFAREARRSEETLAVLLYHRGLAHEALGHASQAHRDFARVRKLGFEPNEQLF